MVISEQQEILIARFLASRKLSHRKIAKLVGVSRGTINQQAAGKRKKKIKPKKAPRVVLLESVSCRCIGCGAKAFLVRDRPFCLECVIRMKKEALRFSSERGSG